MPETKKEFKEPLSSGSSKETNASTDVPEADQIVDDADEPCSCCSQMMRAMSNAQRSTKGGGK